MKPSHDEALRRGADEEKTPALTPGIFPCPIELYHPSMADEVARTPPPFQGIWFHTTSAKSQITRSGWNPGLLKNSIYGAAVYLCRDEWDLDKLPSGNEEPAGSTDLVTAQRYLKSSKMIGCVLALQASEVQTCFAPEKASGVSTITDLLAYLNQNVPEPKPRTGGIRRSNSDRSSMSVRFGPNPGPGSSRKNREIASYFLAKGVRAIHVLEHDTNVVAVYDPSCIRVLSSSTQLNVYPFSDPE